MRKRTKNPSDEDNHCKVDKNLRIIQISGEITQSLASTFRRFMKSLEVVNKPITVEINSPGGDIEAGLMIVDTIRLCKRRVTTRVTGQAYSMACVIACVGDRREILPNSILMAHQGSFFFASTYDNLDNEIAFLKLIEERCWEIMDRFSNKKRGYWKERCGTKDFYMTADIAIREGLVDRISKG